MRYLKVPGNDPGAHSRRRPLIGVNVNTPTWYPNSSYTNNLLALGVEVIRTSFLWSSLQSTAPPGNSNATGGASGTFGSFTAYDGFVTWAEQNGIKLIMSVILTPAWARDGGDPGNTTGWYRPDDFDDYAWFFEEKIVKRYGDRIWAYEVWNEPNYGQGFWPSDNTINGTTARSEYVQMVQAVRARTAQSRICAGGLSNSPNTWVGQMFSVNGLLPGDFGSFSHHPYTSNTTDIPDRVSGSGQQSVPTFVGGPPAIRDALIAQGVAQPRLHLTEFSWSAPLEVGGSGEGVTEFTQANYLARALEILNGWGSFVDSASWYILQDSGAVPQSDFHSLRGLLYSDFSWKPSARVLRDFIRNNPP